MVRFCLPGFVLLLFVLQVVAVVRANSEDNLVRKRREWILPARNLMENVDYMHQEYIARIRSDHESESNIHYSLEGIGANQYPFHVFVVDPKTGLIRVTQVLDREIIDTYNLSGVATYTNGQHAEKKIDIRIKVLDENDNSPVFGVINPAEVYELSPKGMSVKKVIAMDADEPGNENSQIAYSIIAQNPPHDMFNMSSNGTIYTNKHTLDRETQDQYILTVKGQDLNGKPEGKTGTGTVTIFVLDVNDNPPTLEKEQYEGSIEENTQGVEVMRLKAQDLDLKGTDNWEAVFDIVKGNEAGYFSIKTDPNSNEGILMLDKSVDYEDVKDIDLGIVLRNKSPLHDESGTFSQTTVNFGSGTTDASGALSSQSGKQLKTYPVKINVKNQPEGPRFDPKVKAIPISEGAQINLRDVIGRYPAIDGDTGKPAENVKYAKGLDPDNWLIIDPTTAEIRLNKKPDRESKFLVNGTYTAQVLCITEDMPAKTATGTIAIQVEDYNDHCPTLTGNSQTMCTTDDAVIVNAEDEDADPNGPPFDFAIVPEGTRGKWKVEHLNDTAAILRAQESLWPGYYEVEFVVTDEQGQACPDPQKVKVVVCTCEDRAVCSRRGAYSQPTKKAELGPAAIGLLLLGLLILLLIPLLLLICTCGWGEALTGNFMEMPFNTKSHLINYHTEGQGENTVVPLMNMPMHEQTLVDVNNFKLGMGTGIINGNGTSAAVNSITYTDGMNMSHYQDDFVGRGEIWESFRDSSGIYFNELENRATKLGHGGIYDGMALSDHILGEYYSQKVDSRNENLAVKDGQLVSNYEGQGSAAGSVGCCSLLECDNDLQFLDDLGPKFQTLAEVCGGVTIPTEVKQVSNPLPSTSINTQTSVSSVVSVPQLPSPPKLQSTIQKTNQTVVRETSERSQVVKESTATPKGGMTTVNQGMGNKGQMLLLQQQQPVYFATTPVLQPMHYVVQPQVQNTVLLAEAPATNLQSMVLVNGAQTGPIQSVVVQGQTLMSSAQPQGPGMVLVERSGGQGGNVKLIQAGNLSGTKTMMITEGKVPTGSVKVLKESQTTLMQGHTLQLGGLSGSQRILVVEPTISGGQLVKEAESLSQKSNVSETQQVLLNMGNTFTSPQTSVVGSSTTTMSKTPICRKVGVEDTKEIH